MAPPQREEVVEIDGDTSSDEEPPAQQQRPQQHEEDDDDEEVVVITPKSRKRRRQSTIMDEDDEGEASQSTAAAAAAAETNAKALEEIDDDDDGDDVEILQVATPGSRDGGSASKRKSRRLTILESDEEPDDEETKKPRASTSPGLGPHAVVKKKLEVEPVRRQSLSRGTPTPPRAQTAQESAASSSSRRSSRIERKREEKEKLGSSARKLEFLSLDNCLDRPSAARRATAEDDDDDEFIVDDEEDEEEQDEEEEEEEERPAPRRKPKAKARARTESRREREYADGDDDLDDFLADDDEIEYMDDDEEGVMEQPHSSADEMDEDADEARAVMQSREPSEWFALYLRYLEECILDEELDNKIRTNKRVPEYRLFEMAKHHIERQLCSRRDALRSSVVWNEDIMDSLHYATKFVSTRCTATTDCQACRRTNHFATQFVQFGGFACDARELYKDNWMKKLRRAVGKLDPVRGSFELGSVCHARTLGYWQLLHAKHFWAAIVDAKRRECGGSHGRITEDERKPFYKSEYGRYKRLIALVDKFSSETTQSVYHMPNVWKKVNATNVHSEFLPSAALARGGNGDAPRRGTLDSVVGDSDAEETEEDEEEEEEEQKEEEQAQQEFEIEEVDETAQQREQSGASADEQRDDALKKDEKPKAASRKRMWQSSILSTLNKAPTPGDQATKNVKNEPNGGGAGNQASPKMKAVDEIEAEDLLCLVCRQNQRDGAIAHGNYLHFYCCYRCAKRQHAANHGCMVCDRPIDRVLRILPLSKEARSDILTQQAQ